VRIGRSRHRSSLPGGDPSDDPPRAPRDHVRHGPGGLGSRASLQVADGRTMSDMATILVVDDDPIVRDVVVRYLERDGHRTLAAGAGDRAGELLRPGRP